MIKKILSVVVLLIVLLGCCACEKNSAIKKNEFEVLYSDDNIFKYVPIENISKYQHVELVDEFESEISTGYKNEDGTYTLYIFSSPIRYKKGVSNFVDVDNRLKNIYSGRYFENGFFYTNNEGYVSSFFPKTLNEDNNFLLENDLYELSFTLDNIDSEGEFQSQKESIWGQKNDSIIYSCDDYQVNAYATKAGIRTEIVLNSLPKDNKIKFTVKSPDLRKKVENDYIIFVDDTRSQDNQIQSIVRTPIVKDSYSGSSNEEDPHLFLNNRIETESIDKGVHTVSFVLDEAVKNSENIKFPVFMDILWDMHTGKQPDSSVYSEKPYDNNYLQEYSVVGNSPFFGTGQNYLRLRLNEYIDDNPSNVKSATYYTYEMSGFNTKSEITLNKVESFWSSSEMNWMTRVEPGYNISSKSIQKSGYVDFDITEIAKKALEDETCDTESYGIAMVGNNVKNSYRIFASSDNPLFPPFEAITFYDMPENINIYRK